MARMLATSCSVLGLLMFAHAYLDLGSAAPADAGTSAAEKPVVIRTPRPAFLLGEPVILVLAFKNVTRAEMSVVEYFVEDSEPPWQFYLGRDRDTFKKFHFGYPAYKIERPHVRNLKPGEVLEHEQRLFHSRLDGGALAFSREGIYFVKVVYPFLVTGSTEAQLIESNVMAIQINKPTGQDAEVWQRMQDPHILDLLQSGRMFDPPSPPVPKDREHLMPKVAYRETVVQLLKLMEQYPKSSYRDAFCYSLRKVYHRNRSPLAIDEQARLRALLDIGDIYGFEDKRLDVPIQFDYTKAVKVHSARSVEITAGDLIALLADQSGVSFDASPDLKPRKIGLDLQRLHEVRPYMEVLGDALEASWTKRGDGYMLLRPEEQKVSSDTKK